MAKNMELYGSSARRDTADTGTQLELAVVAHVQQIKEYQVVKRQGI
jgi:hypothetical protein